MLSCPRCPVYSVLDTVVISGEDFVVVQCFCLISVRVPECGVCANISGEDCVWYFCYVVYAMVYVRVNCFVVNVMLSLMVCTVLKLCTLDGFFFRGDLHVCVVNKHLELLEFVFNSVRLMYYTYILPISNIIVILIISLFVHVVNLLNGTFQKAHHYTNINIIHIIKELA